MSKLTHVKTLIAALPATPLRPAGTPQLSNALESIIGRASKRAAGGADGEAVQERIWEGMSGSLERLQNGAAGRAVSACSSQICWTALDTMNERSAIFSQMIRGAPWGRNNREKAYTHQCSTHYPIEPSDLPTIQCTTPV